MIFRTIYNNKKEVKPISEEWYKTYFRRNCMQRIWGAVKKIVLSSLGKLASRSIAKNLIKVILEDLEERGILEEKSA